MEKKKARVSRYGPYIVMKTMGKGSFGKVKMAEHETSKKLVALKLLNPAENDITEIKKEVAFLNKVNHPNITNILDFDPEGVYSKKNGKSQNKIIIAMELAEKGSLFEFVKVAATLNGKGFPEPIARKFFQQMINAIEHCHEQKVVHRDLKPENVLLDSKYNVKIADFGWAAIVDRKKHFTDAGTESYQAPEMAKGKGYDLPPVDIFACGIILFMMLAAHPPFRKADTSDSWFKFIAAGKPDTFWKFHNDAKSKSFGPGFYSEELIELLSGIYEPDPAKRLKISQIKATKWYNGKAADDAATLKEFTRYKEELAAYMLEEKEERRKEKEEKLKESKNVVATGAFQGYKAYRGAEEKDVDRQLDELKINIMENADKREVDFGGELEPTATTILFSGDLGFIYKCVVLACSNLFEEGIELGQNSYKIKGQFKLTKDDEDSGDIVVRILSRDNNDGYSVDFSLEKGDYVDFVEFIVTKVHPELKKLIE